MSWLLRSLLALTLFFSAGSALAQDDAAREEAKRVFAAAGAAYESGDYERAASLYEQAHRLFPTPTAAYWHGKSLAARGKLLAARARLKEAASWSITADSPEAYAVAVSLARDELDALGARIPTIAPQLSRTDAAPTIDGAAVPATGAPHEVDPGEHTVAATAPGAQPFQKVVQIREAEHAVVEIAFVPVAAPKPSTTADAGPGAQRIAGFALIGLGGAGVVVWAITGGLYLAKEAEVDDHCVPSRVDDEAHDCDTEDAVDAAETGKVLGIANTVALIAGVASLAVGVTLVLTAPSEGDVALRVGPGDLSLSGRF